MINSNRDMVVGYRVCICALLNGWTDSCRLLDPKQMRIIAFTTSNTVVQENKCTKLPASFAYLPDTFKKFVCNMKQFHAAENVSRTGDYVVCSVHCIL